MLLVIRLIRPRRAASASTHVGLPVAWLYHFVIAIVGLALVYLIIVAAESFTHLTEFSLNRWGVLISEHVDDDVNDLRRERFWYLGVLGFAGFVEAIVVFLAIAGIAWGAREERIRDSIVHSFRQTFLHTGNIAFAVILCTLFIMINDVANRTIMQRVARAMPAEPRPEQFSSSQEFQVAMDEHMARQEQLRWRMVNSPLRRNDDEIAVALCILAGIFTIGTLFAALSANRPGRPEERDPLCEQCGYNLTGSAMDRNCPECGLAVRDSLGDHVRQGLPWQHNRHNRIKAWFETARVAIFSPTTLGRSLKTRSFTNDHHSYLVITLVMIFVASSLSLFVVVIMESGYPDSRRDLDFIFLGLPLISFGITAIHFFSLQLGSLSHGARLSRKNKRNLLGVTNRIAAYLSPFAILWTCVALATGILAMIADDTGIFEGVIGRRSATPTIVITWFGFNMILLSAQSLIVRRAVRAAQYANT